MIIKWATIGKTLRNSAWYTVCTQCVHAKSLQLCLTLCDTMDCSPLGFSVCGILQARILEWVAMTSRFSQPRDGNRVSLHLLPWQADGLLTPRATWEPKHLINTITVITTAIVIADIPLQGYTVILGTDRWEHSELMQIMHAYLVLEYILLTMLQDCFHIDLSP